MNPAVSPSSIFSIYSPPTNSNRAYFFLPYLIFTSFASLQFPSSHVSFYHFLSVLPYFFLLLSTINHCILLFPHVLFNFLVFFLLLQTPPIHYQASPSLHIPSSLHCPTPLPLILLPPSLSHLTHPLKIPNNRTPAFPFFIIQSLPLTSLPPPSPPTILPSSPLSPSHHFSTLHLSLLSPLLYSPSPSPALFHFHDSLSLPLVLFSRLHPTPAYTPPYPFSPLLSTTATITRHLVISPHVSHVHTY